MQQVFILEEQCQVRRRDKWIPRKKQRDSSLGLQLNWEEMGFLGLNYTTLQGIANIAASDPSKMKPSWTGLNFLVQDDAKSTQERVRIIFKLVKGVKIGKTGAKESFQSTVIASELSIKVFATVNIYNTSQRHVCTIKVWLSVNVCVCFWDFIVKPVHPCAYSFFMLTCTPGCATVLLQSTDIWRQCLYSNKIKYCV